MIVFGCERKFEVYETLDGDGVLKPKITKWGLKVVEKLEPLINEHTHSGSKLPDESGQLCDTC